MNTTLFKTYMLSILTGCGLFLPPALADCLHLGVPAYFWPTVSGTPWVGLQQTGAGGIVILNPNSGPGTSTISSFVSAVQAVQNNSANVYGYVRSGYGTISLNTIKNQIGKYRSSYHVNGIFIDEAQLDSNHLTYYKNIANYIHSVGLQVAFNPGQPNIDQRAVAFSDAIVIFEHDEGAYATATFPSWVSQYPASKFWHLVYGVPATDLQWVLTTARSRNAGFVYATDDDLPNPWDTLPSYWSQETNSLCSP